MDTIAPLHALLSSTQSSAQSSCSHRPQAHPTQSFLEWCSISSSYVTKHTQYSLSSITSSASILAFFGGCDLVLWESALSFPFRFALTAVLAFSVFLSAAVFVFSSSLQAFSFAFSSAFLIHSSAFSYVLPSLPCFLLFPATSIALVPSWSVNIVANWKSTFLTFKLMKIFSRFPFSQHLWQKSLLKHHLFHMQLHWRKTTKLADLQIQKSKLDFTDSAYFPKSKI